MRHQPVILAALLLGCPSHVPAQDTPSAPQTPAILALAQDTTTAPALAIDAPAGADIEAVLKDGGTPLPLVFIASAPGGFYALDLANQSLTRSMKSGLRDLARDHAPSLLEALEGPHEVATPDVRVARDGIFSGRIRVASVSEVVRFFDRNTLVTVTMTLERKRVAVLFPYRAIELPSRTQAPASPAVGTPAGLTSSQPAAETVALTDGVARFPDMRLRRSSRQGWAKEQEGAFVSDPKARQLRFEVEGKEQAALAVGYDDIRLLHYEAAPMDTQQDYHYYLLIRHETGAGDLTSTVVRALSGRDVASMLATLELHTGLPVERTMATESFSSVALKLAPADKVVLTDVRGRKLRGRVTSIRADALTLATEDGSKRMFKASDINRLRLAYDAEHDGRRGFDIGGAIGFAFGALVAGAVCDASCGSVPALKGGAMLGLITGAIGSAVAVGAGAAMYSHDAFFDVYTSPGRRPASGTSTRVTPLVGPHTLGLAMVVRP